MSRHPKFRLVVADFLKERFGHVDDLQEHSSGVARILSDRGASECSMNQNGRPGHERKAGFDTHDGQEAQHLYVLVQKDRLRIFCVHLWHSTLTYSAESESYKADHDLRDDPCEQAYEEEDPCGKLGTLHFRFDIGLRCLGSREERIIWVVIGVVGTTLVISCRVRLLLLSILIGVCLLRAHRGAGAEFNIELSIHVILVEPTLHFLELGHRRYRIYIP